MCPVVSLADKAYFSIKNKILRGELQPGFPLREEYLSEMFSISRTPLRKALTQLLAEGFLIKGRDRTLRVPYITVSELQDTMKARKLLETAAAAEACKNCSNDDISRLEHIIDDEREAWLVHDNFVILTMDSLFHNFIAQTSKNKIYAEFVEILGYKAALYLALSNTLTDEINYALEEHKAILNAFKLGLPDKAADAMSSHIENVEKRIFDVIKKEKGRNLNFNF